MECIKAFDFQHCRIVENGEFSYDLMMEKQDINELLRSNLMRIINEQFGGNQLAFSKKLGLNPTYVNSVVRGKKPLGKPNWEKICKKLNIRSDEFLQHSTTPVIQGEHEQHLMYMIRDIEAAGMIKEAEKYLEYLADEAKKKSKPGSEGTKGGVPRRGAKRAR